MSGSELSVECELRNRKNQAAYLLADNRPTKSRRGFLPFRNLQIHLNKLAQQVELVPDNLCKPHGFLPIRPTKADIWVDFNEDLKGNNL